MISKTNNTNFGAAYLKINPKGVKTKPVSVEIPEEPVYQRLNEIVAGSRDTWEAHSTALPQTPALKPRIQINPNSPITMTVQIGEEEYLITQSHNKYHDAFMGVFNAAKEHLQK